MRKYLFIGGIVVFISACGDKPATTVTEANSPESSASASAGYDESKGAGKFTQIDISPTLDGKMAEMGNKIYDVKCGSCHKLTEERLVGPGWKGVTGRHKPEWIMNFVTNVDEMLEKDPKAQAQLEICLVRMPNQNLTDDDARHVYEFMRKNDGVK